MVVPTEMKLEGKAKELLMPNFFFRLFLCYTCSIVPTSAFVVGVLGQMQGRPADVMILNMVPVFGCIIDVLYTSTLKNVYKVGTEPDFSSGS